MKASHKAPCPGKFATHFENIQIKKIFQQNGPDACDILSMCELLWVGWLYHDWIWCPLLT